MDSGRGFRNNKVVAKCRGFVSKSRGVLGKYLRFRSDLRQDISAGLSSTVLPLTTVGSGGGGGDAPAAALIELKTTLGMSLGAAIVIYSLLNSTATKVSPHSLYLLIGALIVSFSASLIGLSFPWVAKAMEFIAVASIAVSFFMAMSLLLPEGKRWMALLAGTVVLLLYLGPSLRKVYHRIFPH